MPNRPEEQFQRAVVDYLELLAPRGSSCAPFVWFHPYNGARLTKAQAGIGKAMGVLAGVPDLCLIGPDSKFYGIELKADNRGLSDNQKNFHKAIQPLGGRYMVCRSIEEVAGALKGWGLIGRRAA